MSTVEFPDDGYTSKIPTQTASFKEEMRFSVRNDNSTKRTKFL